MATPCLARCEPVPKERKVRSISTRYNNGYSTNYSSATTAADQAAISREIGSRMMASGSSAVQSLESGIRQTSWGKNLTKEQMSQVIDTVSAGVSAGLSTPEIFKQIVSLGFSSKAETAENDSSRIGSNISERDQKSLQNTFQTTNSSDLSKAREAALTETDSKTFLNNAGVSDTPKSGGRSRMRLKRRRTTRRPCMPPSPLALLAPGILAN